jgi:hypothetical protein
MKVFARCWIAVALALVLGAWLAFQWWSQEHSPRARSAKAALALSRAVSSGDQAGVRGLVKIPEFLSGKTHSEQSQLLTELLSSEISAEGLAALRKDGQFGALREMFPTEADAWAKAFGVTADQCVAFKMKRGGLEAELVLLREGDRFLVLRCNNVRQMAGDLPVSSS